MLRRTLFCLSILSTLFVALPHYASAATKQRFAPAKDVSPVVSQVVNLLNQERAHAGLMPLQISDKLQAVAQTYSQIQAQHGIVSHVGPDGSKAGQRLTRAGYRWQRYGENLAAGQPSAEEVVAAWLNSPGHRANMLNPKFREIGVGTTHIENDPSAYVDYWVMELGTPR